MSIRSAFRKIKGITAGMAAALLKRADQRRGRPDVRLAADKTLFEHCFGVTPDELAAGNKARLERLKAGKRPRGRRASPPVPTTNGATDRPKHRRWASKLDPGCVALAKYRAMKASGEIGGGDDG